MVFFSIGVANGEMTGPLLFTPVLGADWGGKRLGLGGSLVPKTSGLPLDFSALVVFAGGKKLNLGGSLLSNGSRAAWSVVLDLKSKTGVELAWI